MLLGIYYSVSVECRNAGVANGHYRTQQLGIYTRHNTWFTF